MSQTKRASLAEAIVNTFIGFGIAMVATHLICWVYDIPLSWQSNAIITFWMTLLSIARSYVLRRLWNAEFWK